MDVGAVTSKSPIFIASFANNAVLCVFFSPGYLVGNLAAWSSDINFWRVAVFEMLRFDAFALEFLVEDYDGR